MRWGMVMSEKSIGQEQALQALVKASETDPAGVRINVSTLRLIVELAWSNQYETENRSQTRRLLAELLSGEVSAFERRSRDAAS